MPPGCQFYTKKCGQIVIISLEGYFEKSAGAGLRGLVQSFLNDGFKLFAFGCRKLTTINSPGITSLLDLAFFLREECGGKLVLFGLSIDKRRVLSLAGMTMGAAIVQDEEEALSSLQEDSPQPDKKSP